MVLETTEELYKTNNVFIIIIIFFFFFLAFQERGFIVGTVGARFEVPGRMEYAHCYVSKKQNTSENGYGEEGDKDKRKQLSCFAKFYNQGNGNDFFFPSFEEAQQAKDGFVLMPDKVSFLNVKVYTKRMRVVFEAYIGIFVFVFFFSLFFFFFFQQMQIKEAKKSGKTFIFTSLG